MKEVNSYDAIVIGGSYAGLSAAMALGRSLRKTLVIDNNHPCNASTPYSHNFLTQDGKAPKEIRDLAKSQLDTYDTLHFLEDLVSKASNESDAFKVETKTGRSLTSSKLIFATGIKDILPDIPGFEECWGKTIIHCPYCHGYEFKGQKTGIMATHDTVMHMIPLLKNLTDDLVVLTEQPNEYCSEEQEKLKRNGIALKECTVAAVQHENGQIQSLQLTDSTDLNLDALYAPRPFVQHTDLPMKLGCELTESGHIQVDGFQKTSVEGIFACGDNASPMRSVANAVAMGNIAGAVANMELSNERLL